MMENNTSHPYGANPNSYVAGLVELDYDKDKQELIRAESQLHYNITNLYWAARVDFLRDKIVIKKKIEQNLRDGTFNRDLISFPDKIQIENENENENETEVLNKINIKRSAFEIDNDAWKTFDEENPPIDTLVWLKLQNNNIVLAAHGNNVRGVTRWWKVIYKESDHEEGHGEWLMSGNEGYITKNAVWQSCLLFL